MRTMSNPPLTIPQALWQTDTRYGLRRGRHMSCDVVFGAPSADCMGTGVCKIMAISNVANQAGNSRNCRSALGIISKSATGMTITFPRERMSLYLFRRHFRYGGLQLDEPCELPEKLVAFLGLEQTTLQPGWYPVEAGPDCYKIHFF